MTMSTKSTLFLTEDNEHCYEDCAMPHYEGDDLGKFKGYTIVLEMAKKNIRIIYNDDEDLIIEIDPGSELYNLIRRI